MIIDRGSVTISRRLMMLASMRQGRILALTVMLASRCG